MSKQFKLPDLGEGIHEAEVVAILVKEGDQIQEGQPFMEVETDKARVELPSPYTGTIQEIKVKQDDSVKVGAVLVVFGEGESPSAREAGEDRPAKSEQHRVAVGSRTLSPEFGVPATPRETTPQNGVAPARAAGPVPASPATRRLAREMGVDLRQVPGSGPSGLVTAQDVRAFAEGAPSKQEVESVRQEVSPLPEADLAEAEVAEALPTSPLSDAPPLPDFSRWGSCEKVPLKSVRRATAKHMALAWSQIPHVNHQDVADITNLDTYRRAHRSEIESMGGQLTTTVFVMKAVVAALKASPRFNCSLDIHSEEIIVKHYYHLGVAADTDRGLVVPVVRDVDRKSIADLSIELKSTAERARAGETTHEEMQGGTFTITNIGALGGTGFAPIINYPEVAILGMGRARLQPVVVGDETEYQIVPRLLMPLVLAFDHRVLDGADAARFMGTIIEALENPDRLWLRI